MAHPDPPPAEFPVDPLSIVRAWLWRHSSQPNGDPWDGDPEHLDWAARNLLDDLARRLIDIDPSIGAAEQDPGPVGDHRDVYPPAAALIFKPRPPRQTRRPAQARSSASTP